MGSTHSQEFDNSREFEIRYTTDAIKMSHEEALSLAKELSEAETVDNKFLFKYCCVFTFYRRNRDIEKCIQLYGAAREKLEESFHFNHLYSIAIKMTGRRRDIAESIAVARKSLVLCPRHVGATHNLAVSLYMLAEADNFSGEDAAAAIREADELVEEAIAREPRYAKFYSTRAQILSAQGNYEAARTSIARAIELEDSSTRDYSLRLSDYLSVKSQIELRQRVRETVSLAEDKIAKAVNEAKRSNIEILSFFVAAIALVIGGLNFATGFSVQDALLLIFSLASALLLAVSGFSLLYMGERSIARFGAIFVLAIIMLLLGFLTQLVGSMNVISG